MLRITIFSSIVLMFNLHGMEQAPNAINLPVPYAQPTMAFNFIDYARLMLTNDQIASHPPFKVLYDTYGAQIMLNTCPALKQAVVTYPDDKRLGIVVRYAKAVALRLALFPEEQRVANIEWARFATPKDLREMHYICEGVSSDVACGKANPQGCQKELKKRFQALLKEFLTKIN